MPVFLNTLLPTCALLFLITNTTAYGSAIHLNQIGFYPDGTKKAVAIGAKADTFHIFSLFDSSVVFKGALGSEKAWDASEEKARIANFSSLKTIGEYFVRIKGCPESAVFKITPSVHQELVKGSIRGFYFNRASTSLQKKFADKWARKSGHPDTVVYLHPSAASNKRPSGSTISSPGGWYDAGDFGKYIVNSGISTNTLLTAYETFPQLFDSLKLNIPESNNSIPDLLDEVLWNLRWMLTMQDPNDGGVYHKLTSLGFCGYIMPDQDSEKRYVIQKTTAAALNFAAVTAQASRILKKYDSQFPNLADSCLKASRSAWSWARKNPDILYDQNKFNEQYDPDVTTGPYRDDNVTDEFQWAAIELYITTKQDSFLTAVFPDKKLNTEYHAPAWPSVATLGLYSLFNHRKILSDTLKKQVVNAISMLAQNYAKRTFDHAYEVSMLKEDYIWGSNSVAANQGIAIIFGYLATGDQKFKSAALDQMDYLLGRNPTGYSYVTGFGDKSPMFIHHRASKADGIVDPVPGFLAGGPNARQQDKPNCDCYSSTLAALSYVDSTCSYASNEVAINWNAPLAFLSGACEVIYSAGVVVMDKKK